MALIRIQKYLSQIGFASRAQAERYIENGWVKLNGLTLNEVGASFDPDHDKLSFNSKIKEIQFHYFLYFKPGGIVTVGAQRDEKEIKDIIKLPAGVVPVGRLDKMSTGLILLTDDAVVAKRLMMPEFEHEKEYEVQVDRPLSTNSLKILSTGVPLFGEKTRPPQLARTSANSFRIVLTEGKNRQIRRICEAVGYRVSKIHRTRIETLNIGHLHSGTMRKLSVEEIQTLKNKLKIKPPNMEYF